MANRRLVSRRSSLQLAICLVLALPAVHSSCTRQEEPAAAATELGKLPAMELPYAEGREQVDMYCVPCHSLRYIHMQPVMPRKNWEKIVDKMIKSYGAPVRDSVTAARIVNYLVAIKGPSADSSAH